VTPRRKRMLVIGLLVLGMGVYPKPVTDMTEASVKALLEHVAVSKLEKR